MDIGGSEYDVYPADCAEFTGKSFRAPACIVVGCVSGVCVIMSHTAFSFSWLLHIETGSQIQ